MFNSISYQSDPWYANLGPWRDYNAEQGMNLALAARETCNTPWDKPAVADWRAIDPSNI